MSNSDFSHLVEIDESIRMLRIDRVFPDGGKDLFTEIQLPPRTVNLKGSRYEFTRTLGENILLDSPAARRAIGFDAVP